MRYTYVDIGTSDFSTSLDKLRDDETALLVEPLFHYLANLPNPPNAVKAPFAVSDFCGYAQVYHTPEEDIKRFQLPDWVRGCNSFNQSHPDISNQFPFVNQKIRMVPVIDVQTLISLYHVDQVDNVKIDTEGHDHVIVTQFIPFLDQLKVAAISFEYKPTFTNTHLLDQAIIRLSQMGFVGKQEGDDYRMRKV